MIVLAAPTFEETVDLAIDQIARYGAGNPAVIEQYERNTASVPSRAQWSPRFGFNWDVTGDQRNLGIDLSPDRRIHILLTHLHMDHVGGLLTEGRLVVSDRAHAILPYHVLVDGLREDVVGGPLDAVPVPVQRQCAQLGVPAAMLPAVYAPPARA